VARLKKFIINLFVEGFFKRWYRFVSNVDKKAEVVFMNYGFAEDAHNLTLEPHDEPNRYPIQLYHQLVRAHDLENKDILEIGCGRGGGLAFLTKLLKPKSALGIDRDPTAVEFCNKFWGRTGLKFMQGDAQSLSLPDNSFDVIINVESCHRYENMDLFLGEVKRLLRPNGIFLLTDFRVNHQMEELIGNFNDSGLHLTGTENVTPQVVKALELDDHRRRNLVKTLVPRFLHGAALNFAGAKGSPTYVNFATGRWIYFNYNFSKTSPLKVIPTVNSVWSNHDICNIQKRSFE
jgi:SAM-dependent methyltransferase